MPAAGGPEKPCEPPGFPAKVLEKTRRHLPAARSSTGCGGDAAGMDEDAAAASSAAAAASTASASSALAAAPRSRPAVAASRRRFKLSILDSAARFRSSSRFAPMPAPLAMIQAMNQKM